MKYFCICCVENNTNDSSQTAILSSPPRKKHTHTYSHTSYQIKGKIMNVRKIHPPSYSDCLSVSKAFLAALFNHSNTSIQVKSYSAMTKNCNAISKFKVSNLDTSNRCSTIALIHESVKNSIHISVQKERRKDVALPQS